MGIVNLRVFDQVRYVKIRVVLMPVLMRMRLIFFSGDLTVPGACFTEQERARL